MHEVIRAGQVWQQRYGPRAGRQVTVLEPFSVPAYDNTFVTVQGQRRSSLRASTLRSYYRLVKDVKP